ncbi:MAG: YicC family protein [Gammaproteobacteria bacterium]|nr:YicC family protein [Gammaproteobacteria bacterium]
MTRSMTGFARGEARGAFGTLIWELRTVNHRYLDVSLRLPEELRSLDPECRVRINAAVRRGKLDGQLRLEPATAAPLALDEERAHAVAAAAARVAKLLGDAQPVDPLELLRWPGVVKQPETEMETTGGEALRLLDEVLMSLTTMRRREGERIVAMLQERARRILTLVAEIRQQGGEIRAGLHDKLRARFEELKLSVDGNRLEQELVLLLQRLDVTEELDRLDSHVTELRTGLKGDEAVGRRLDFLMQEFNRETNTLGSKTQDAAITRQVVELKVLIEQMREQVQNIE